MGVPTDKTVPDQLPLDEPQVVPQKDVRRERPREVMRFARSGSRRSKDGIVNRVIKFYEDDLDSRSEETAYRLNLYAKYRQWSGGKSWPWEDSSDQRLPDMTTDSLRTQDTLHNSFMSARPPITSKAVTNRDEEKQKSIDELQDYQFFTEQNGEKVVEEYAESFCNDPAATFFVPWIRERRKIKDVRFFDAIPYNVVPINYFRSIIEQEFGKEMLRTPRNDGWDWKLEDGDERIEASFYTSDDGVEMVLDRVVTVFDGPKVIVKDYDDVLHPPRVANLQRPSPSNPEGSPHVILVDRPTVQEIRELKQDGFYHLLTEADLEKLESTVRDDQYEDAIRQKDSLQGVRDDNPPDAENTHRRLTRLTCFDVFDMDGDGVAEDVVWWVLKETKMLMRVRPLAEMYPANPPMRPFAEACFLPVKGRRDGISLLELLDGIHDLKKQLVDMMIDGGSLSMIPFGFYRASSNMKPETIRLTPGDLYPLSDPSNDISFPNMQAASQSQSFGLNMLSVSDTWKERLSSIGDLQLGRVPLGKASALRTAASTNAILSQGEARPERILRRFFSGFTQVWHLDVAL